MVDVHNKSTRSYNMSQIKGRDTKPEWIVRKYLHRNGLRYSLHNSSLPGKPDLCLRKYRTVIFINGCFWHGHKNCKYFKLPETRKSWWERKIGETVKRDKINITELKKMKWNCILVWECELKPEFKEITLEYLLVNVKNNKTNCNEEK